MIDINCILEKLQGIGYNPKTADIVANELMKVSPKLLSCVNEWLSGDEVDHECNGYSIKSLMDSRQMTYPAALLTIDWLIKEPEKAKKSLEKGNR